jgi:putative glycosyl hydrolase
MYGLNIDPLNSYGNPPAAELAALGVQIVRYTYHDHTPGPGLDPAMVDFYSRKIEELNSQKVSSLLILGYDAMPGKPAYDAPAQEWAIYTDKFVARVEQIARVFGPKGTYSGYGPSLQIWNEPDLAPQPGYEPSLRPEIYAQMLDRACQVILQVERETGINFLIVGAGLASGDPSWWQKVYMGTIQPINALAIHPYGQRPTPDFPHPTWGFGYVGDLINNYRAVWGGKIWITECGCSTPNEAEQAEYLRRFYQTIQESYDPPVDLCFWFCYADGMVAPYGLVRGDTSRKVTYGAYAETASLGTQAAETAGGV